MSHVAIAGSGIIGLTAALELRAKGFEVTVVDRGPFGAEASSAAGGMLAPQLEASGPGAMLELGLRSRALWPALARQVEQASGHDVDYRPNGVLRCAFDDGAAHHLDSEHAWQNATGLRSELVDAKRAQQLEPLLNPKLLLGLYLADDHAIDPSRFMPALVEAARKAGVTLRTAEVRALQVKHGRATGLELADGALAADRVVNALGAWATRPEGFGLPADVVKPVRGQIIELATPLSPRVTLGSSKGYLLGRKGGKLIAGSTKEDVGYDKSTTEAGIAQIRAGVEAVLPQLAGVQPTASWSGLRPGTRDEAPLIGPSAIEGLCWATGHYRNGILLAPVTARLVGQWAAGQALPAWAGACNPARFA
ncbi:MAG: glycine oxidase ThiO [Myxococcaceae bacterium]